MMADDINFADKIVRPHADDFTPTAADRVLEFFSSNTHWAEHPAYPLADWRYDVSENNTRYGYVDWCISLAESEAEDETNAEAA